MLYVGANTERLLVAADMMDLHKKYADGYYREFSITDVENFEGSGTVTFITYYSPHPTPTPTHTHTHTRNTGTVTTGSSLSQTWKT